MVSHMKTTIEISDALLNEVRKLTVQQKTTLRALVEQGLREVLSKQKSNRKFKLQKASFKGNGLQADFQGESWQRIRAAAYEGHGG